MRSGGLFAGYGGLDMAVAEVFGAEPAWFSEIDDAPSKILAHHWPDVPNHGDITQIDWDAVEPVDILSGGFPCQDVSAAGKRAGLHPDTRSGLWNHMAYAISKLRPRYVVAENVRGLLSAEAHSDVEPCPWCLGDGPGEPALRALGAVLGDLAELGYDAQWCGLRAADVGAPHGRFRIFILARDTAGVGSGSPWTHRGEPLGANGAGGTGELAAADTQCGHGERRERPIGGGFGARRPASTSNRPAEIAADATHLGHERSGSSRNWRHGSEDHCDAAADAQCSGWDGWSPDPVGEQIGRTSPAGSGTPIAWGGYRPAIERWERVLGHPAPAPTETSAKGSQRLSPQFVEWMMGLPAGHVAGVPGVNRNAQLKALGNGVVPQQAIAALRHMLSVREVAA